MCVCEISSLMLLYLYSLCLAISLYYIIFVHCQELENALLKATLCQTSIFVIYYL